MSPLSLAGQIAAELNIRPDQAIGAIDLLDASNTIPFIARYRKEATGSLDEVQLRQVQARLTYLRNLRDRQQTVLASIAGRGSLTPELAAAIEAAATLQEVEDLYLPYRPRRRTRAMIARERGLEPLADLLLAQEEDSPAPLDVARAFVQEEVPTAEEALAGARDIIAEQVSDDATARALARHHTEEEGLLVVSLAAKGADPQNRYQVYQNFQSTLDKLAPHQWLAISRGEKEGVLRVALEAPDDLIIGEIENQVIHNPLAPSVPQLRAAVEDGYHRLIAPAIEREARHSLAERAGNHAIGVFATNLRSLLLQPPLRNRVTLGLDPGYRTGCKVAVVDGTGKVLETFTIYPHDPQKAWERSREQLEQAIERWDVQAIAIGNGTASRETEQLVAELVHLHHDKPGRRSPLAYAMVNEAGASVYSASDLARQELPELDVSLRGAVSIARRLQDPLAELVKIDPQSIGVGLYQHDVDQKQLAEALDAVVEDVVNAVGVDVNTASPALLRHVAGIGPKLADAIVEHRNTHGPFQARRELLAVKGLGPRAYQQAAGFLRVPESPNPLDRTNVHPESYGVVKSLLELAGLNLRMIDFNRRLEQFLSIQDLAELAALLEAGPLTLQDILDALLRPGHDPRDDLPAPILRQDILTLDDLSEGMVLKGTVRNVVDFGAFVDIGVKQDGLVHVSQMAEKYVRNPHHVVQAGDVVEVRVVKLDRERKRISLSMRT